jgi:hypothetical protein
MESSVSASTLTRLWKKVDRSGDCWIWLGSVSKDGYGRISIGNGARDGVHRVAYASVHGPIPDGMHVLHNCPGGDNPRCVNPDHLWLGTHAENMRDKVAKGRQPRGASGTYATGERVNGAKLRAAEVIEIRNLYPTWTCRHLAFLFGVSKTQIAHIIEGRYWKSI